MQQTMLLGGILLSRVVQSITGKSCSRLMPSSMREVTVYMSLRMGLSAFAAMVSFLVSADILEAFSSMSVLGFVLAMLTGVAITVSSICGLMVLNGSSVALGSLFSAAGLLVPTIGGIFIYNQNVKIGQWAGILALFAAAMLLASSSGKTNGKITPKTVFLLFGSMLSNGATMLLQTLYKTYVPEGDVSLYSLLQFAIPSVVLFAVGLLKSKKEGQPLPKFDKMLIMFTVLAAVALFSISQISTVASAVIPVAVLFPISDGGGTVISAIVAAVMFKERFTVKSALGVIVGVAGLVMIKLLS